MTEVLSPSIEEYDRRKKRETYARLGVPHYWMVDHRSRAVVECILQPDGVYQERTIRAGEPFRPALFPDLEIDLAQAFR